MKRVLLIPLLMISMLTGCDKNKEEPLPYVSLTEWISDLDFADGHFYNLDLVTKNYGIMPDYNYVVSDNIKTLTKDIEGKETKEYSMAALLTYIVSKEHEPFESCFIYIHEDSIETHALTPFKNGKVREQNYSYPISSLTAAKIVGGAYQRAMEIVQINKEEEKEAKEQSSPTNFCKKVEESEKGATLTLYGEGTAADIVVQDTNKALLSYFKAMEFTEATAYSAYKRTLTYAIDENLSLTISPNSMGDYLAEFEIKFDSSLGYTKDLKFPYLVAKKQVDALLDIVKKVK